MEHESIIPDVTEVAPAERAEDTPIPVDERIFESADAVAAEVVDPSRRAVVEDGIAVAKTSAFRYAGWALDRMVETAMPKPPSQEGELLAKLPSHGLRGGMVNLQAALSVAGKSVAKVPDSQKGDFLLEQVALRYAKRTVHSFVQQLANEQYKDVVERRTPQEIANALRVPNKTLIIQLVQKASELPDTITDKREFLGP